MKLITRNDIENWAETYEAKGNFPNIISQLISATTPQSTKIDFPSGSAANIGGWDGIVICEEKRRYVPIGISLWEIGTEDNPKGKAEKDYQKRTADALGYDTKQCTFIFVTPKFWKFKDKWVKAKLNEGKWNNVLVYDSSDIEQWFETAAAISRQFSSYIGKYPSDGIVTVDEFWKEWALGPKKIEFSPKSITVGRENEMQGLLTFLSGEANIKAIKATTRDEAVAFIIACAKQFETRQNTYFFSKTLIINNTDNFRSIRINVNNLNLIAKFEEKQPLFAAVSDGHHVLVPLGPDDTYNGEIISLPTIDRDGQIDCLVSMGFSSDEATRYSKEAGRDITILKRLLKFNENKIKWLNQENARELLPALFLGRWNENFVGDKKIIEKLSGHSYDDYLTTLNKFLIVEESPLLKIGETWRLTSPLDAWTYLSPYIQKNDLEKLRECFFYAFKNGNPIIEIEGKHPFVTYKSQVKTFSSWAREGLVQSLILIGNYGNGLKIPSIITPQVWVDNLCYTLLYKADDKLWSSLNKELPLIAESSPSKFYEAVFDSLNQENPPIMNMFVEEDGLITPTSNHTGLLWALEALAWMPEFLFNSSSILLKLASFDPGGKLSNRPINSLIGIFKSWHYQTLSSFDERMEVLKQVTFKEKSIGWTLLIKLISESRDVAFPTNKMRWRLFSENTNLKYTGNEVWKTNLVITKLLITIFDHTENQFAQLIEASVSLGQENIETILSFAEKEYTKISQTTFVSWHAIRNILGHHRSHPDTNWALPENILIKYESLYYKLEPLNIVEKYIWLFNDHWPELPEGLRSEIEDFGSIHDKQQLKIDNVRHEALQIILATYGIEKIKELSYVVKQPHILGDTLAKLIDDDEQVLLISDCLNNAKDQLYFIHSFFYKKAFLKDNDWIFSVFEKLKKLNYENKSLAQLFVPVIQNKSIWDFINSTNEEIIKQYWLSVYPMFYNLSVEEKILGLEYLVQYGRFISALNTASHFPDDIPSNLIVSLLRKVVTEIANETGKIREYEATRLFKVLDTRNDVDRNSLINLEWLYLPILSAYRASRSPKILHEELSLNPIFFIDILKWVFIPEDENIIDIEKKEISDERKKEISEQAFHLLHSWKLIPGSDENGTIDEEFLNNWIDSVRALAIEVGRLKVADAQIGEVLAQYSEEDLDKSSDLIFRVIERINTDSIKRNFSAALFNKRSFSSRGAFDGGDIERNHAKYFEQLAVKIKGSYPNVSAIFRNLTQGYLVDAKRWDEEAERDKLDY